MFSFFFLKHPPTSTRSRLHQLINFLRKLSARFVKQKFCWKVFLCAKTNYSCIIESVVLNFRWFALKSPLTQSAPLNTDLLTLLHKKLIYFAADSLRSNYGTFRRSLRRPEVLLRDFMVTMNPRSVTCEYTSNIKMSNIECAKKVTL